MSLVEAYQKIKPSIVAFIPMFHPVYNEKDAPPEFPPIFGTGFIIADGLVITNDHVVRAIRKLPKPPDCPKELWPVKCLLLHLIPDKGMAQVSIDILGVMTLEQFNPGKVYYGPPRPDIAFVHIKMKDLPRVDIKYEPKKIREGLEVATAGFPMGTDTLMAPGYLHQLTPTLQRGVISAVLPFECQTPHALMINVMTQGGASGSPVFLPDSGEVIGVLYAGLQDIKKTIKPTSKNVKIIDPSTHSHLYKVPTNASYVVPSHFIISAKQKILTDKNFSLPSDTPSLKQLLEKRDFSERKPGISPEYAIWGEGDYSIERKIKNIQPENPEKPTQEPKA